MPEDAELARGLLDDLLHGLARSRKGKQAIIAVDAPNRSFQWIGTTGETKAGISDNTCVIEKIQTFCG